MARAARWCAAGFIATLIVALVACSTGEKVDLGDDASGRLIAAIGGEPDQLDPSKTSAYFSFEVLENVFDTLVEPDADLQMRPALAESWDVTPDQLTWTFHLRRGVTFHDGSPLTADDVVFSYRRIIDEELANVDKFSAIADIRAANPSTVVIRLKQPTPEPADQPRRLQGHGDRAAQERRERSDRDPPDRNRARSRSQARRAVTRSR